MEKLKMRKFYGGRKLLIFHLMRQMIIFGDYISRVWELF